jgi:hypothetical protein
MSDAKVGINPCKGVSKVGLSATVEGLGGRERTIDLGEVVVNVVGERVEVVVLVPKGAEGHTICRDAQGGCVTYRHPKLGGYHTSVVTETASEERR